MDRKKRLIEYFNSSAYVPLKISELRIVLDVPDEDAQLFSKIIAELEAEGKITISKRGRIVPLNEKDKKYAGVLRCSASGKFGFVALEDQDDIHVSMSNMGNALHGDKVLVKIIGQFRGKPEGSIIKVLEQNKDLIVGVVTTKKLKHLKVKSDDKRFFKEINVSFADSKGAVTGQRVVIDKLRVNVDGRVWGKIVSVLGDADDLSSLVDAIVVENKIKTDFDESTINEANKINEQIKWNEQDREDLRDMVVFTIDGKYAKDFDDAVSISQNEDGTYKLGVHIADVSEYVLENSYLDAEAFERGTSVYLPGRVIPMLPEKLSNGVCSLKPDVDRLTLTVFMDIDDQGRVVNHKITKSVIRSNERLVYEDINKLLSVGDEELHGKYSHILADLQLMKKLADILNKRRICRGAVDFDFPESEIITDENGVPVDVRIAERGVSNRMIEEFMLVANETVAEFAFWAEIPCIYRSHESPSSEKLSAFKQFLKPFGLSIKGKIDEDNPVKPNAFKQILDTVRGTSIEGVVARTMLRSLMKADYRDENLGHFGLAAKYYCHFTSPIRRYPDLIVHRSLKRLLDNKQSISSDYTKKAAKKASEKEVSAEKCERDCDDMMKAAYMSNFIGKDFDGVVSSVNTFGMFVDIGNGIEGLVKLENMMDDYYKFDEIEQKLIGERTNKVYTVGDGVSVLLVKSDALSRRIDFVLSEDANYSLINKFSDKPKKKLRGKV